MRTTILAAKCWLHQSRMKLNTNVKTEMKKKEKEIAKGRSSRDNLGHHPQLFSSRRNNNRNSKITGSKWRQIILQNLVRASIDEWCIFPKLSSLMTSQTWYWETLACQRNSQALQVFHNKVYSLYVTSWDENVNKIKSLTQFLFYFE